MLWIESILRTILPGSANNINNELYENNLRLSEIGKAWNPCQSENMDFELVVDLSDLFTHKFVLENPLYNGWPCNYGC